MVEESFQCYAVGGLTSLVAEWARDFEWLAANSRSNLRMAWSPSRSDLMVKGMIDGGGAGEDLTFS